MSPAEKYGKSKINTLKHDFAHKHTHSLGLGATYVPHHKAVGFAAAIDERLKKRLESGAKRKASRSLEEEGEGWQQGQVRVVCVFMCVRVCVHVGVCTCVDAVCCWLTACASTRINVAVQRFQEAGIRLS